MLLPDSDGDLLRQIATGGPPALGAEAAFCKRFAPRIRLYGLRHLKSEERAQDLVQAVLLIVLQAARAGTVQEPDKVERFVLGTCRNLTLKVKAGEARARPLPDEELVRAAGSVEPEVTDVGGLVRCLRELDVRARNVLVMTFHEDLDADEVAARLQTTAGNVRVVRHRAIASLRRCLDGVAA